MTFYYPMAKVDEPKCLPQQLFTFDGFQSEERAVEQFSLWEDLGYNIEKAYVQVCVDGVHVEDRIYKKVWQYEATESKEDRT